MSIMDMLGGAAPSAGGAPPGGPPGPAGPGAPPPGPASAGPGAGEPPGDTVDVIKQMIDLAKGYLDAEDDDVEKAQMVKVLQTLQDFLAREQKEADDAMGGKMSPKLMRQAYAGA